MRQVCVLPLCNEKVLGVELESTQYVHVRRLDEFIGDVIFDPDLYLPDLAWCTFQDHC